MAQTQAFAQVAATITLTGNGTTSVDVALPERLNGFVLHVVNTNTVPAFVRADIGAQPATASDAVVNAGGELYLYVGAADNVAIVLSAAGTAAVYATPMS